MSLTTMIGTAAAAERLAVNRSTLTRWVQSGRITPVLIVPGYKGDLLFDPADVSALAEGKDA